MVKNDEVFNVISLRFIRRYIYLVDVSIQTEVSTLLNELLYMTLSLIKVSIMAIERKRSAHKNHAKGGR